MAGSLLDSLDTTVDADAETEWGVPLTISWTQ